MKKHRRSGCFVISIIGAGIISVQPVFADATMIRSIPNTVCMEQNKADNGSGNIEEFPPVYRSARSDALQFGVAAGIIIATDPPQVENGRRQIVWTDGSKAWVDSRYLKPWIGRTPDKHCTPVVLSNGRWGFTIR